MHGFASKIKKEKRTPVGVLSEETGADLASEKRDGHRLSNSVGGSAMTKGQGQIVRSLPCHNSGACVVGRTLIAPATLGRRLAIIALALLTFAALHQFGVGIRQSGEFQHFWFGD